MTGVGHKAQTVAGWLCGRGSGRGAVTKGFHLDVFVNVGQPKEKSTYTLLVWELKNGTLSHLRRKGKPAKYI